MTEILRILQEKFKPYGIISRQQLYINGFWDDDPNIWYSVQPPDLQYMSHPDTYVPQPLYIRAGKIGIFDASLLPVFGQEQNTFFMNLQNSILVEPTFRKYTLLTIRAMELVSKYIENNQIIDLGSADGPLSFAALQMGASSAVALDYDKGWLKNINEHIALNTKFNGKITFFHASLAQMKSLPDNILHHAGITVANIGPQYGEAHLEAIDNTRKHIPNLKIFIAGGYYYNSDNSIQGFSEADRRLNSSGFKIKKLISDNEGRVAFIALR